MINNLIFSPVIIIGIGFSSASLRRMTKAIKKMRQYLVVSLDMTVTPGPRAEGYWSLDDMEYIVCDVITTHHLLT